MRRLERATPVSCAHTLVAASFAASALTLAPRVARADVFLPPIPVVDFFLLGFPQGPLLGLAVLAVCAAVVIQLRRRKVHGCLAAVAALAIFGAADCASWVTALNRSTEHKRERRARWEAQDRAAAAADAGTDAGQDAGVDAAVAK